MATVKDITDLMQNPSAEDLTVIAKAYDFAEKAHAGQRRVSGEPYFLHLVETAKTLAELGMGTMTISAGLLHDSIEDVNVKPESIEREFGKEIRFLVEGVTKLGKLHYSGAERYTESLRKLCVAMSKDVRVLIIKLADRLQNMKTLEVLPKEKRERIALETLEIYAPLAYRLGIRKFNRELEDLAFPHVHPVEHRKVKELLKTKSREKARRLEKFHKGVLRQLARGGVTEIQTGYRLKGLYSLYRKLLRKNWDIEKIYDISALRIIVPTVGDCYRVLGLIHNVWRPLPGRIKDYIAFPKPNNYRGIHTTIFTGDGGIIEVQIRTQEMHRKTEYGMHFEYKETAGNPKPNFAGIEWVKRFFPAFILGNREIKEGQKNPERTPSWIQELGEYNKEVSGAEEFVEDVKSDFFSDRVFVFTPKGDVIDLPTDSSPVDFAYAIHSDIGNHMSGAKVNGKLAALETKLQNGDIVEIVTKPPARPSRKWLAITKTTLAKKHIKAALET
ncbi:MAG: bifunctional (p)ppGpp synthetase/guanosine-3',5'-bis(diphosphate) 3'-pyrophosphohydrolase [Candidatus Taylorbacteria bacterium]|nr:bifunctional (p)ppGpp synthetase/guanosine-3',5'-bis(diphosphate) 3'-pyrophosphohydrolase [Candidatus Taylorbacteria bacterium]